MLELMKFSKDKTFGEFKKELKDKFGTKGFSGEVQSSYTNPFDISGMPDEFTYATGILLDAAENMVRKGSIDAYDSGRVEVCLSDMSTGMSFSRVNYAESSLPKAWKGSYECNLFEYSYLGLLFLREEVAARFEKAYEVWRNSCSYGERVNERTGFKYCVWYFTSFDNYFFAVNPFKGLVLRSMERAYKDISRLHIVEKGDSVWVEDIQSGLRLASINKESLRILPTHPMDEVGSDLKKSEKEKRIAEGKKQKQTRWLSVNLGKYNGSNSYMRVHSLICLLVYGLEIMAPAIMEANSIFTVDHINSQHDDNRLENLQLVSRKNNNNKKGSALQIFDYFCYFNNLPQPKTNEEKISEEKCEKNTFSPIDFSAFSRVLPKQDDEPLKTFVIKDFDDDFDEMTEEEEELLVAKLCAKAGVRA